MNQCSLRHSSRSRPLKLSMSAFCTGLPGTGKVLCGYIICLGVALLGWMVERRRASSAPRHSLWAKTARLDFAALWAGLRASGIGGSAVFGDCGVDIDQGAGPWLAHAGVTCKRLTGRPRDGRDDGRRHDLDMDGRRHRGHPGDSWFPAPGVIEKVNPLTFVENARHQI